MTPDRIIVLLGGVGVIAFLAWFFFGKRSGRRAETRASPSRTMIAFTNWPSSVITYAR